MPPPPQKTCSNCGEAAPKLSSCSRCKSVWYCQQSCQSKHWKAGHKKACAAAAAAAAGVVSDTERVFMARRKEMEVEAAEIVASLQRTPENQAAAEAHAAAVRADCPGATGELLGKTAKCDGGNDCPNAGLHVCARCKSAFYCSAACQQRAWPTHKRRCKELQKELAAEAEAEANGGSARNMHNDKTNPVITAATMPRWLREINPTYAARLVGQRINSPDWVSWLWEYMLSPLPAGKDRSPEELRKKRFLKADDLFVCLDELIKLGFDVRNARHRDNGWGILHGLADNRKYVEECKAQGDLIADEPGRLEKLVRGLVERGADPQGASGPNASGVTTRARPAHIAVMSSNLAFLQELARLPGGCDLAATNKSGKTFLVFLGMSSTQPAAPLRAVFDWAFKTARKNDREARKQAKAARGSGGSKGNGNGKGGGGGGLTWATIVATDDDGWNAADYLVMRRGLDDPVTQFCVENGLRPAIPVEPGSHNGGSAPGRLSGGGPRGLMDAMLASLSGSDLAADLNRELTPAEEAKLNAQIEEAFRVSLGGAGDDRRREQRMKPPSQQGQGHTQRKK